MKTECGRDKMRNRCVARIGAAVSIVFFMISVAVPDVRAAEAVQQFECAKTGVVIPVKSFNPNSDSSSDSQAIRPEAENDSSLSGSLPETVNEPRFNREEVEKSADSLFVQAVGRIFAASEKNSERLDENTFRSLDEKTADLEGTKERDEKLLSEPSQGNETAGSGVAGESAGDFDKKENNVSALSQSNVKKEIPEETNLYDQTAKAAACTVAVPAGISEPTLGMKLAANRFSYDAGSGAGKFTNVARAFIKPSAEPRVTSNAVAREPSALASFWESLTRADSGFRLLSESRSSSLEDDDLLASLSSKRYSRWNSALYRQYLKKLKSRKFEKFDSLRFRLSAAPK